METYKGTVGPEVRNSMRLDRYISEVLRLVSRSQVKARNMSARVNGTSVKVSRLVEAGDLIELAWNPPEPTTLIPEELSFDILYEDDRVIVINKAQGLVVHPGAGNKRGTMANGLLFRRNQKFLVGSGMDKPLENDGSPMLRPGIVHRLDKDTSGVIIATYDDDALNFLADQFKRRLTRKTYVAIIRGRLPKPRGRIETFIARDKHNRKLFCCTKDQGKPSVTLYRVVQEFGAYSLVLLRPKTGRTHQLRVHMRYLGCPILGDPLYSGRDPRFPEATLMLHALRLSITLPGQGKPSRFTAPLPERFKVLLRTLKEDPLEKDSSR